MPQKPFEADDPLKLTAVCCPGSDEETQIAILVEEYCRMGMPADEIRALFRSPFYGLLHHYFQRAGEAAVERLVTRVTAQWGTFRYTTQVHREGESHA